MRPQTGTQGPKPYLESQATRIPGPRCNQNNPRCQQQIHFSAVCAQPRQSCVTILRPNMPKRRLPAKVFKQALWMVHYQHATWKRTHLWSTSRSIARFNLGSLVKKAHKSKVSTARQYYDGAGKKRYVGTSALRSTQHHSLTSKFEKNSQIGLVIRSPGSTRPCSRAQLFGRFRPCEQHFKR